MKQPFDEDGPLKQYLLGQLSEAEREGLEYWLLSEPEAVERLLIVEDDLIDSYVRDELGAAEREQFEFYFLSTSERQRKLRLAKALKRRVENKSSTEIKLPDAGGEVASVYSQAQLLEARKAWWQWLVMPTWQAAVAALLIVAFGLVVWRGFFYRSEIDQGLAALQAAYREQRPLEARLSGFAYAPRSVTRGQETSRIDVVARDRASIFIHQAFAATPSPASRHALGQLYLAQKEFDKAVDQLEAAVLADSANPRFHCDLGTALFERGKARRQQTASQTGPTGFEDLAKSLTHFEKALALDSSRLEALFNLALCQQQLALIDQAKNSWQQYLQKDQNSRWADEARQHLRQLSEAEQKKKSAQNKDELLHDFLNAYAAGDDARAWQLFSQNREAVTGRHIFWQLLQSYLEVLARAEPAEARQRLDALAYVAELEEQKSGDDYAATLTQFYRSLSPPQRSLLNQAQQFMRQGHQHCLQAEFGAAIECYQLAKLRFQQTGNLWETRFADYWIGYCYLQTGQLEQSLTTFERLAQESESKRDKWLLALSLNSLGAVHAVRNEYTQALTFINRSLAISEQLEDTYGLQKNLTSLAILYKELGDYRQSVHYLERCLELANQCWPGARQMWRNYEKMTRVSTALGMHTAALNYGEETLRLATEINDPAMLFLSHVNLSAVFGQVRQYAAAMKQAQLGLALGESRARETAWLSNKAYAALQLGHLNRQTENYSLARSYYNQALQLYDRLSYPQFLYDAHKGNLLCHIAENDQAAAQQELALVLNLFEEYRAKILAEKSRNSFFDAEQEVYEALIDFAYSRLANDRLAFEYAEVSRARSLFDLLTQKTRVVSASGAPDIQFSSVSSPLKLAAVQAQIPEQVQLLQYAALDNKLLIWVVSKTNFFSAEVPLTLRTLNEKVQRYLDLLARASADDSETLRQSATELYRILLSRIEPSLNKQKQLCIIPDKILCHLPFSTLIVPASGKYLVAEYVLSFAPSTNVFIACSTTARQRASDPVESLLSVGNPTFDQRAFPTVPLLPSARQEAERISQYYAQTSLFTDTQAREAPVKQALQQTSVINFASHYLVDENSPLLSKLLLAHEPEAAVGRANDGVLQAFEIVQMKLPHCRLVVLSACSTGVERYYKGEGMIGGARVFLAAGAPLAVASLWPIDSDSAAELIVNFHRYRKRERYSTAQALQRAQLEMLNGVEPRYRHPSHWAAFMVIGGYANF